MVDMSETTPLLEQGGISKLIEWNGAQDRVYSVASSHFLTKLDVAHCSTNGVNFYHNQVNFEHNQVGFLTDSIFRT